MPLAARTFRPLLLLLALAAVSPGSARAALTTMFELNGVAAQVMSGDSLAGGHSTSDVFNTGFGFGLAAHIVLGNHLAVGFRTGYLRDTKDIAPTLAPDRWSNLPNYNSFRAATSTNIDRRLSTIPNHLVLNYRAHVATRVGYYAEAGVGVSSFTEKLRYEGPFPMILAGYQKNLSFLGSAGLSWDYGNVFTVVGGASYLYVPSKKGQVFAKGDNPQFLQLTLGIRYPKR